MSLRLFTIFTALLLSVCFSPFQVGAVNVRHDRTLKSSSPFEKSLAALQKQIGYPFKNIGLLRRAMTHASFSEENNRALSILGAYVIETSVALHFLNKNIEMSSKVLNRHISEISNVESSCAVDGMRLGLEKVIRVSSGTNSSVPAVVCGAFRATFGAIAIDAQKSDDSGNIFWLLHGDKVEKLLHSS